MTNLLNKFIIVGTLTECRVDLYPTHLRAKFGIDINGHVLTVYHSINKKFHTDQYNQFIQLLPCLRTKADGFVWANSKKYYPIEKGSQTRLFLSGNMTEKRGRLFFNAEWVQQTEQDEDRINISMQGIWTDSGFMNIVADSPRVFLTSQTKNYKKSAYIYQILCVYLDDHEVNGDVVKPIDKLDNLAIKSIEKLDSKLDNKDIANWLLEWEIINEDS